MKQAATTNPAIASRVEILLHRVHEEFYDLHSDPDALNNLIHDPAHAGGINEMRAGLLKWMEQTKDPLMEKFKTLKTEETTRG
jgi:N-sulfoglucosamine sulfohydrolase